MSELKKVIAVAFSTPSILVVLSLVVFGLGFALCKFPTDKGLRKNMIGLFWAICVAIELVWGMQQQYNVLSGATAPTSEQPVAVTIKGVIRYVSEEQAVRHSLATWVFWLAFLALLATHVFFFREKSDK
ncbi:hypothetical protein HPT27_15610 [Permianibacter sp. IMCC34836]|uniref:hypothetical protein n=1 Tax=Permianibacter fluminis TaxID=2738515 RepID=UPI0015535344|nr:hypothetical protein [Permianibacter fluminis]NQD38448.1 hypothetical protein [Permianibacter fluminis]